MTLFGKLLFLSLLWVMGMALIIGLKLYGPFCFLWTVWMIVMVYFATRQ